MCCVNFFLSPTHRVVIPLYRYSIKALGAPSEAPPLIWAFLYYRLGVFASFEGVEAHRPDQSLLLGHRGESRPSCGPLQENLPIIDTLVGGKSRLCPRLLQLVVR